jgi:hypothetical protein
MPQYLLVPNCRKSGFVYALVAYVPNCFFACGTQARRFESRELCSTPGGLGFYLPALRALLAMPSSLTYARESAGLLTGSQHTFSGTRNVRQTMCTPVDRALPAKWSSA